jgi:hypothetical protein
VRLQQMICSGLPPVSLLRLLRQLTSSATLASSLPLSAHSFALLYNQALIHLLDAITQYPHPPPKLSASFFRAAPSLSFFLAFSLARLPRPRLF